ncbi:UNVERIFIED_CONTAM: hypothetical protein PYX00_005862 [Menopon gallinae]|uniref:Uncharacterized protein n=1 Tax=Menopon gallinae TaxID=328185 RepID=A0AAW2HUX0_9NEOP
MKLIHLVHQCGHKVVMRDDDVYFLDQGRIVESGTHDELLRGRKRRAAAPTYYTLREFNCLISSADTDFNFYSRLLRWSTRFRTESTRIGIPTLEEVSTRKQLIVKAAHRNIV